MRAEDITAGGDEMEEDIKNGVKKRMKDRTDWKLIGVIRRSIVQRNIFNHLAENPSSASDLAWKMGMERITVSYYFTKLKKLGVIEPYTNLPNYQIYGPTEKGEKIAKYV